MKESENKMDYSWLLNQTMVGLRFYNQPEFNEEGTIYTVTRETKNTLTLEWVNTKTDNWPDQTTKIGKDHFIDDLNRGFLTIYGDDDIDDLFNQLNESSGPLRKKRPNVGDILYCHTDLVMDSGVVEARRGNGYRVISADNTEVFIIDDSRDRHSFKYDDESDYTQWFKLITQEEYDRIINFDFFGDL